MAKQILNRREKVYATELPPEIQDKATLETALRDDGFVTNADYASSATGGVIKIAPSSGTTITSGGTIQGSVRTADQYDSAATSLIVSKGTLENVIASLITKAIADMCGALDSDDVGTTYTMQCVEKTADGYIFVGGKTAPITP